MTNKKYKSRPTKCSNNSFKFTWSLLNMETICQKSWIRSWNLKIKTGCFVGITKSWWKKKSNGMKKLLSWRIRPKLLKERIRIWSNNYNLRSNLIKRLPTGATHLQINASKTWKWYKEYAKCRVFVKCSNKHAESKLIRKPSRLTKRMQW